MRRPLIAAPAVAATIALGAIAAAAGSLASPATTSTAGPWSLAPGEYYAELSGSSFATESMFNDDSKRVLLDGRVSQRSFRSSVDLGWTPHWSAQLSLPFVSNVVRGTIPGDELESSGLEDFALGLRYKLWSGASAAAVQLRWETPAGYNTHLPLPIGDGLQKLSASLQLGGPAGHMGFWELGGGYRYDFRSIARQSGSLATDPTAPVPGDRDWSDHVTVNAAYGLWLGPRFMVAGLYGADFPIQTGRGYEWSAQAAGPRFTYRVDERLDAFGGSWHTPAGRNVPHLDQYYAGVAWKLTKLNRLQGFLGSDKRP